MFGNNTYKCCIECGGSMMLLPHSCRDPVQEAIKKMLQTAPDSGLLLHRHLHRTPIRLLHVPFTRRAASGRFTWRESSLICGLWQRSPTKSPRGDRCQREHATVRSGPAANSSLPVTTTCAHSERDSGLSQEFQN